MSPVNISVIGGSGFLGTRLLRLLSKEGFQLHNIDKNGSHDFSGVTTIQDIRDPEGLRNVMSPASTVIHLAAEHRDDVTPTSLYYDVNVQGTRNILDAMDRAGITSIIFTSTVAVYGLNRDNPDENEPVAPFNHYGKSKWQAEELIREWQRKSSERSAVILRPSVIFGETNRGNVYNFISQMASGRFLMIGRGKNQKSMAYVGNVAAFIQYVFENMQPGCTTYNYTDLPDITTWDLIGVVRSELGIKILPVTIPYFAGLFAGNVFDLMARILHRKFNISAVRIKKFCATTRFNAEKAHSTGFKVPHPLIEALQDTIRFEFSDKK